ncbi:MAG TPA: GyrI-like domain-containing protein [Ornithinibacter sp.]|nr:GyrI-like domain-containing protein [Ornithinibacter sp.]HQD69352.1 GyrI-like domain-containing protein [Ornithinibacter sp.]
MVEIQLTDVPPETVAMVRRVVPMGDLTRFFGEAFERVAGAVPEAGGAIAGPPFGWYHGMPGDTVDVAAGFPVSGDVHVPDGGVVVVERPGGRALVAMHVGSYDGLGETWGELERRAEHDSVEAREDFWEEYLSDPRGDPSTWRTRLVMLIA